MGDGLYCHSKNVWEDLTKGTDTWMEYWGDKSEPELLAVACGTKNSGREAFI